MSETPSASAPRLLDSLEPAAIVVNGRCIVVERSGVRSVLVNGVPVYRYDVSDKVAERVFVAQALELGYAKPRELEPAVSCSMRTLHRAHEQYVNDGLEGLVPKKRGPKAPRLGDRREAMIRRWHAEGQSVSEMARRLEVSRGTVYNALRRLELEPPAQAVAVQGVLLEDGDVGEEDDGEHGQAEETPDTSESEEHEPEGAGEQAEGVDEEPETRRDWIDPDDRWMERLLASIGELDDAEPLFAKRAGLPRAGALLAVPLLTASGVFEAAEKVYGSIGPAFYGLRTSLLALLMLALLRIKNAESLKRYSPVELGHVLGLDRAPEMKTLRRKLAVLAGDEVKSEAFVRELVKRRVAAREEALGYLYVDGHVRVYSGKEDLPKAHVARMRISLPATQEMWVHDADGAPLFFLTQEAHPQLVSALPRVLEDVRGQVGEDRRVTVVFDRGGWSPKLFKWMEQNGFDVLTYRKGKVEPLSDDEFEEVEVPGSEGKERYDLADTEVHVGTIRFPMRQVTRRTGDHQTHIVTTRRDLATVEVAVRMFARWQQENFFKYMRAEYAIDALVDYGVEAAEPSRTVPNPDRKAVEKELRRARAEVARLAAKYGTAAMDNPEEKRPTIRGFKIAHGAEIGIPLRAAQQRVAELEQLRIETPERVEIGAIKDKVVRLRVARKRLSDALKMLAYQVETDLAALVEPYYARSDHERRPLITAALQSTATIEPVGDELRVTVRPQSSPHRSQAISELCRLLNNTHTRFPGSHLRLRFAVEGQDCAN